MRRVRDPTPIRERLLGFRPPLAFDDLLRFLARRALPGIERVRDGVYERVLGPVDATLHLRVERAGRDRLRLRIAGGMASDAARCARATRRVFDLDRDPRPVARALARDARLAPLVGERPGLRVAGAWDGFELVVRAVLGQQVSVAGATTLAGRLVSTWGAVRHDAPPGFDRAFPEPATLAEAPLERIGLPRQRASTLRGLAAAVTDGRLRFGRRQSTPALVDALLALPGIGPWTAHYVAMRLLRDADAFPAGDLVVRRRLGGATPLPETEALARAEAWRPYRAYALMHLWHEPPR